MWRSWVYSKNLRRSLRLSATMVIVTAALRCSWALCYLVSLALKITRPTRSSRRRFTFARRDRFLHSALIDSRNVIVKSTSLAKCDSDLLSATAICIETKARALECRPEIRTLKVPAATARTLQSALRRHRFGETGGAGADVLEASRKSKRPHPSLVKVRRD